MIRPSACEISLLPEVAHEHGREARVTARGHDCDAVTDRPQGKPGQPLLQPESHGRGYGTVDDRDPARGAATEERADERDMHQDLATTTELVTAACQARKVTVGITLGG